MLQINYFIDYLMDIIELKTDVYTITPIKSIVFSYGIRNDKAPIKTFKTDMIKLQSYYNNKLPISFNPLDYDKIIHKFDNKFIILNEKALIIINQIDNKLDRYNLVEYYRNNKLLFKWKDIYVDDYTFNREIGKSIYTIKNNEIILHKVIKPGLRINILKNKK